MAKRKLDISAEGIRQIRKTLNLNQAEFWGPVGVTQSGGSRYESGRDIPNAVKTVLRITYGTEQEATELFNKLRKQK